jgi:hypothetical protein
MSGIAAYATEKDYQIMKTFGVDCPPRSGKMAS